ncbi:lim and transglutaminase domain protein ltd-1-like isoform X1 [Mytilus galloprovincialis]|uniref:lim and transglutaminase domain protein ltd-1-like isoform X1 n=2 Tax=Mytilus galloprovincialis TaxID=29158 RepID=UPI003F7C9996
MGTECSKSDVQEIVEPEPVGVEPEPIVVESEPVESEREESPEPVENTPPPSIHKEPSIASSDEQNKASDFEEFFITFESDSDEIKLPPIENEYPAPVPNTTECSLTKKIQWFENTDPNTGSDHADNDVEEREITKAEIDHHARTVQKSDLNSFHQLIKYLDTPIKGRPTRDEMMVRIILVWLSNQVVEQFVSEECTDKTPLGFLSLLGQRRSTYSTFFTVLCRTADVKCAQIHGVCKAGDYQPGDTNIDNLTCLWNAVYIQDSWRIIHPYWVCRSVFGKRSSGWIKLEEDGKAIGHRTIAADGVVKNAFKEYYIMPDPSQFIYRCHPDSKEWQLLPTPISREIFLNQAYLLPPFWAMEMKLVSKNACCLFASGKTLTLTFETSKATANTINLDYEFLLKEGSAQREDENEMLKPENMPRLVAKIRNASEWNFDIQFPIEGIYKIVIYGGPDTHPLLRLCEFKIICTKRTEGCRLIPFNPGKLGFGPGPESDRAGLLLPSHRNGIITIDRNNPTNLRFLLASDTYKSLNVETELVDFDLKDKKSSVKSVIENDTKELKIITNIVQNGDYGLRISTSTGDDLERLTVVCNYLITTSNKLSREKANQRVARRKLLSSIENGNNIEITESIKRCLKEKILENDSDIENAQRKLDVLQFRKAIHDAVLRNHLGTIEKTIHCLETSLYERIFRKAIQELDNLANELRSS